MTRGRRTKLTPVVQQMICRAIEMGATKEVAAQSAGICQATLYNWIARGEAECERLQEKGTRSRQREAIFVEFLEEIRTAEARGEVLHIENIYNEGAAGSRWILPRRHPERWALTQRQEITGAEGAPLFDIEAWTRKRQERLEEAESIEGE